MLAQRAEEISKHLLVNGKKEGNYFCVGSIEGEPGSSLKVCLSGEKGGVWADFATGQHGDMANLWSSVRKISLIEALKEATRYLGIGDTKFEAHRARNHVRPVLKNSTLPSDSSPVLKYLITERKLNTETITAFKIQEKENVIVFPYWREDELVFVKYLSLDRPHGKKQMRVEANCEPCLFGWQALSADTRSVVLVEGELDCLSLYQYGFPALSVPFGGGAGDKQKWIEFEYDRLAVFDEVFICLDNDAEGQAAVAELIERLGRHRCRVVKLPYKDANECLQKDVSKEEIQRCFDEARTLEPEELKAASEFVNEVIDQFYPKEGMVLGYNPPWNYTKGKILFRPEELSIWSGTNGHGKSQLLGHIILESMKEGARVCVASLEIKPKKLLMRLTRQAAGLAEPTEEYIRAIHEWYSDKLWLFDIVGTAKTTRLLEVFLYARQRYGIDVFVIDSFMKCGIDEEDFKAQKAFIEQLCDFKNQYGCHIHLVAHPRKSSDEMQIIGKLDVKGSGAITDLADNCFIVWRNKEKEELQQKQFNGKLLKPNELEKLKESDCILRCDKQRNGEWEGKVALWFDRKSFQYLGSANAKVKAYVEYSSVAVANF